MHVIVMNEGLKRMRKPACPHCGRRAEFWVSAWKKLARNASTFCRYRSEPKIAPTTAEAMATATPGNLDDDIPWK